MRCDQRSGFSAAMPMMPSRTIIWGTLSLKVCELLKVIQPLGGGPTRIIRLREDSPDSVAGFGSWSPPPPNEDKPII